MSKVILVTPLVLYEVCRSFVNSVVRQVHEDVIQVVLIWWFVFSGSHSTKTLFVEEDAKWVHSTQVNVDSQIKLKIVNKEWFVEVALHHIVLIRVKVF